MTKAPDSLTGGAKKRLRQLLAGEIHPAPCQCPACLYAEYRKVRKMQGRPIGKYLFFLDWLVWWIKMEAVGEKLKISKTSVYFGPKQPLPFPEYIAYSEFQEEYKKAPYLRRVQKILCSLYEDFEELEFLQNYNVICVYKTRFENDQFAKLVDGLQQKRANAPYNDPAKKKEVWTTWYGPKFAQRVGFFIHAQPNKQITRRALLRHFSNKRESDLADILGLLESNFRIRAERRGKSIVYRVIPKKADGGRGFRKLFK